MNKECQAEFIMLADNSFEYSMTAFGQKRSLIFDITFFIDSTKLVNQQLNQ